MKILCISQRQRNVHVYYLVNIESIGTLARYTSVCLSAAANIVMFSIFFVVLFSEIWVKCSLRIIPAKRVRDRLSFLYTDGGCFIWSCFDAFWDKENLLSLGLKFDLYQFTLNFPPKYSSLILHLNAKPILIRWIFKFTSYVWWMLNLTFKCHLNSLAQSILKSFAKNAVMIWL